MSGRLRFTFLASPLLFVLAGCGEPMYDNAGSPHSLIEDREVCAAEVNESPDALAYRQNPSAHPDYPNQVFNDLNRCIERKGWKLVRSQQEQDQLRDAIASEAAQTAPAALNSDDKSAASVVRAVEDRLARVSETAPREVKKN